MALFMTADQGYHFSEPVTVFHERRLPERATPAGYAALIDALDLVVPLPRTLFAIGERHKVIRELGWHLLTPRYAPRQTLEGHLTFALKHEGLDLAVLKRLFVALDPSEVEALVSAKPTGRYARRIWFLYEWLTGHKLKLLDAKSGAYVDVVDPDQQWSDAGERSPRHRVRNNLPGTPHFCPLVFRTEALQQFVGMNLSERASAILGDLPQDLVARTAAFLLLKDSKATYAIEGERAPQDRIQRWGRAIGEAGRHPIDLEELLRLQRLVIGDARFVQLGLRQECGFVGEHDRETHMPLPEHISARPEDLESLISGMIDFDHAAAQGLDAVIAAAVLAFGFVYAHPLEDGNGRIHRYLIHHVLAHRGFNLPGVVFPVSAVMLDRVEDYKRALNDYSRRLLPLVEWKPTVDGNVRVLNETADFYRFFDATSQAEFLYACVRRTIEKDLPEEANFLRCHDQFCRGVEGLVDMPNRTIELMFRFLSQNEGRLSRGAREREFAGLTNAEVDRVEQFYLEAFSGSGG